MYAEVTKIYGENESSIHEIVSEEKLTRAGLLRERDHSHITYYSTLLVLFESFYCC